MRLQKLVANYDKKTFFINTIIFAIIVFFDRVTKNLALNGYFYKFNSYFLKFDLMINRGISWGIFHSDSNIIFYGISFLVLLIIGIFCFHIKSKLQEQKLIIAEIFILSGAISNFIDRIFYGGVIDFIVFPLNNLFVFNIADFSIIIGTLILLIELW